MGAFHKRITDYVFEDFNSYLDSADTFKDVEDLMIPVTPETKTMRHYLWGRFDDLKIIGEDSRIPDLMDHFPRSVGTLLQRCVCGSYYTITFVTLTNSNIFYYGAPYHFVNNTYDSYITACDACGRITLTSDTDLNNNAPYRTILSGEEGAIKNIVVNTIKDNSDRYAHVVLRNKGLITVHGIFYNYLDQMWYKSDGAHFGDINIPRKYTENPYHVEVEKLMQLLTSLAGGSNA